MLPCLALTDNHSPIVVVSTGTSAGDTQQVKAAILKGYETGKEVQFSTGLVVEEPIRFDPSGLYRGICRARRTRFGFSDDEYHIKSIYTGSEPSFSVRPSPEFYDNHPRGYQPCFNYLSLIRDNGIASNFEVRDIHDGSFNHMQLFGGSSVLDIVSDVTGSWKNGFHQLTVFGPNMDNAADGVRIRALNEVNSNENWFSQCRILQNRRSLWIESGNGTRFSQCEIAKAFTQSGGASIELELGTTGTEFISTRIEQNSADPGAVLIRNSDTYLRMLGGTVISSQLASTSYYQQQNAGAIKAQWVQGLSSSLQVHI